MRKTIIKVLNILNEEEKHKMLQSILLDILISIADIASLVVMLFVLNYYSQNNSVKYTFPFSQYLSKFPLLLISCFLIFFSIKNFLAVKIGQKQSRFIYDVATRTSKDRLRGYFSSSFQEYVDIDTSEHFRKIHQDPSQFSHYVLRGIKDVIGQSVLILFALISILIYNPFLFLLLFLILIPPAFLASSFIKNRLVSLQSSGKVMFQKVGQYLNEALSSFVESKVYGKEDFFFERYENYLYKMNRSQADQQSFQAIPARLIEVFSILGLFLIIIVNFYQAGPNALKLITIGVFMAAAYKIIPGMVKILNSISLIRAYSFTLDSLIIQPNRSDFDYTNDSIETIQLSNISFRYGSELVIEDLCIDLKKSDFVGVSGRSGNGKTTLVNLLLGFLETERGEIFINNNLYKPASIKKYWHRISYIKQAPFFLHDSILRNITFEEAEYSHEKLSLALKLSGVDKIVEKLPDGLNTIVGEGGKNFSGGQRQRMIFARALYKDFDVLLLDEPFSELDEDSEFILMRNLKNLAQAGKIVLLITHNKASLSFCNKQLILND